MLREKFANFYDNEKELSPYCNYFNIYQEKKEGGHEYLRVDPEQCEIQTNYPQVEEQCHYINHTENGEIEEKQTNCDDLRKHANEKGIKVSEECHHFTLINYEHDKYTHVEPAHCHVPEEKVHCEHVHHYNSEDYVYSVTRDQIECEELKKKFESSQNRATVGCEFFDMHTEAEFVWLEPYHCEVYKEEQCMWYHHSQDGKKEESEHNCGVLVEKLYENGIQIAHDCYHFNVHYHEESNKFEVDP